MEAEVVHVGDPAIAANLAFVRAPGRLMTHAKDLLDFQVERWLERQDKHFLEGAE